MTQENSGYKNLWQLKEPKVEETVKFTEMQLALMEGGHSLEEVKIEKFAFLKTLKNTLP